MICVKKRFYQKIEGRLKFTFVFDIIRFVSNNLLKYQLVILIFIISGSAVYAQKRISTEEYIKTYKDIAIKKQREYKIPASITLAQGILESGSGNSNLARKANNHFGIKCHKGWKGKTYTMDDDAKDECFRKYKKVEDSYRDHSKFLTQRGRYSFLFEYKVTDYKKWAYGLKKAGYATNPKYPKLLISIIERYDLAQYDKEALGKTKQKKKKDIVSSTISASQFKHVDTWESGRKIYKNNGKKLIIIEKGDTFWGLAEEFEIYSWQFRKYNDLKKNHVLKIGEIIYLQKKKRKAEKKYKHHIVEKGETMHSISQDFGVRLSRLYKMNNLPKGIQVTTGTELKLR